MQSRSLVLGLVCVSFVVYTGVVFAQWGTVGFLQATLANGPTIQVGIDLVIMVALFLLWMLGDARERGISPWPFVVLCCTLGSIGAMTYLLWRERAQAGARAGLPA